MEGVIVYIWRGDTKTTSRYMSVSQMVTQ